MMSGANYNGRQPNNTSYIKTFVPGSSPTDEQWSVGSFNNSNVLNPNQSLDLYIPTNILLGGKIIDVSSDSSDINTSTSSDNKLLERIVKLETEITELKKIISKENY